ncbi:MAG: CvpA family protein [Lachnospiraceae bacterium]|nr:CvpA family protein [Lachnospiraceae bacterium]
MNYIDIGVIVILLFFGIAGRMRGLVRTCFSFVPMLAGLVLTNQLYPVLSKVLRSTFIYEGLKNGVQKALKLDTIFANALAGSDAISTLKLPEFLKTALVENNNPVVYNVLGVNKIEEYIAGYVANICLNVLCMVAVFVVIVIACKFILAALDLIAKLPVINFLNKTGGLAVGLLQGLIVLWVIGILLVGFYSNPVLSRFFEILNQSRLALFLYEKNVLLFMILRIFA